jgi:LPS-assembly protein
VKPIKSICWTALPLLLARPDAALAQSTPEAAAPAAGQSSEPPGDPLLPGDPNAPIQFSADRVEYDPNSEIVTASGDVFMTREGQRVLADRFIWRRDTGEVRAEGNVRVSTPEGDRAYGDSVVLDSSLRDGVIENLLIVLEGGGGSPQCAPPG